MAWASQGASSVTNLVNRLIANDASLQTLHIMRSRKLDDAAYEVSFETINGCVDRCRRLCTDMFTRKQHQRVPSVSMQWL